MLFEVTVTIPAYGVKETTRAKFVDEDAARNNALDDVAYYWMRRNNGNDIDEAREKCDVEFSIKIKPLPGK